MVDIVKNVRLIGGVLHYNSMLDDSFAPVVQKIEEKTTSYAVLSSDIGKYLRSTSDNTVNMIVEDFACEVGSCITFEQSGAGQVYIVAGTGVTINSAESFLKLRVQYSKATLIKTADNTWTLTGDIVASDKTDLSLAFSNVPDETEYTFDVTEGTIDVIVPSGTVVTALVAIFITAANITSIKIEETDQVSGVTANNFTAPKTYAIIAQDGTTTKNWVVAVTVAS
jgi:hypothetical protein